MTQAPKSTTETEQPAYHHFGLSYLDNSLPKLQPPHGVSFELGQESLVAGVLEVINKASVSVWDCLRLQRRHSTHKTMKLCCRFPVNNGVGSPFVSVVKTKGTKAGYSNLKLCKSYWCPVCCNVFREDKRTKIKIGLNNAFKAGYSVHFATLTIPKGFSAGGKFKALNGVFTALINRVREKSKRDDFKLYTIKGLDLTINENNVDPYHLHTHAVIVTSKEIEGLDKWIWDRYNSLMKRRGINVIKKAYDFQKVTKVNEIDDYICKSWGNLDKELTSTNKESKTTKSMGWFKWLRSICKNPTDKQVRIYQEFLTGAKGRRTIDFSRNFNELIDLFDPEEDCVDLLETKEDKIKVEFLIGQNLWSAIIRTGFELKVLEAIDKIIDTGIIDKETEFIINVIERSVNDYCYSEDKIKNYVDCLSVLC